MKEKVEIRELENTVRVLSPFSHVQLFVTLCPVAGQAPLSMGFSWQEDWDGLPFPSPLYILNTYVT